MRKALAFLIFISERLLRLSCWKLHDIFFNVIRKQQDKIII